MAAMTFESKLTADGSFTIPKEAVEAMGLHEGDEITVRIESSDVFGLTGQVEQQELHRRMKLLFAEADQVVREPGKPLSDPFEAAWGAGVEEKARRMGLKI